MRSVMSTIQKKLSDVNVPARPPHPYPPLSILKQEDEALFGQQSEEPFPTVALLYAEYYKAVKALDELWDKELQPQKGAAIKRILQAAIPRIFELKEMLCTLDIAEYHYVDGQIIQLQLVPKDFEIWELQGVPPSRDKNIQENIDKVLRGETIYEPPPEVEEVEEEEEEAEEEEVEEETVIKKRKVPVVVESEESIISPPKSAVKIIDPKTLAIMLIQAHERARQYRLEYFDERTKYEYRNKIKRYKPFDPAKQDSAARTIQRYYRGYITRRDLEKREVQRRLLIGMYVPYWKSNIEEIKNQEIFTLKREQRQKKVQEYIDSIDRERERVVRIIAPGLAEDLRDEIRYWFRNWYDVALCFDKYPTPDEGGTIMVIKGETMTPEEYLENQEKIKEEQERLKQNPGLAQKMKAEAEKQKKMEQDKAKKEAERLKKEAEAKKKEKDDGPYKFPKSELVKNIEDAQLFYADEWVPKWEPDQNPKRDGVLGALAEHLCYEVQLKVREEMDKLMRLELILLEKALAKDTKRKYKKPKKPKKTREKKAPVVEYAQMFQFLYDKEVIRPYPKETFKDFLGDYAYALSELRFRPGPPLDPRPTTGEARQLVWNTCVLPLGNVIPCDKPRSVMLIGPRQCGKKLLVNAICNETKAVLFDITPSNLMGKFAEKADKKMLIQSLTVLTKVLQPSIVFFDGAEKPFYKKVPKAEKKENPKALKGIITPLLKKITPEDRVMIIATTRDPSNASPRMMLKTYDKIIMIPRTDHGTLYLLWQNLLMKYKDVPRNFDLTALTQLTLGYPIPVIRELVQKIMTPRRMIRLAYEPLTPAEIIEHLVRGKGIKPVTAEENDALFEWYNTRVPMGQKRWEKLEEDEKQRKLAELQEAKAKK